MGGNLFRLGRKPRAEYLEIEAEVRRCLDAVVGDGHHSLPLPLRGSLTGGYRIPRYYASKADFGDLDVVLSRAAIEAIGGFEVFRSAITTSLGVRQSKSVGNVFSTVVRDFNPNPAASRPVSSAVGPSARSDLDLRFQVDYFLREPELLEPTYHYLSYNDLGNLIGKIYRRLGLKYGEDGLSYVFRRARQESYKHEVPISRDWPKILAFIGLDVPAWEAGFDTLEHMFAWVVASPYFSVTPYQQQSRTTERRAAARPTMARFLAWLEAEGIDKRYEYLDDREGYVARVAAAFPEANLEHALAHERDRETQAEQLREKFSGERWTGLDGKSLGALLRRFTREYPDDVLIGMSADEIRAAVELFPRDD